METITLRTLVRDTRKVKQLTSGGRSVCVTDNGEPLWMIHPVQETRAAELERHRLIDEVLDDVLRETPSKISAVKLLEASRR